MQRFMLRDDAAKYCGISKTLFETLVRPNVPGLKIYKPRSANHSQQILHYDRVDLDKWCDDFKKKQLSEANEPANNSNREKRPVCRKEGDQQWAEKSQGLSNVVALGTSTKATGGFRSALARTRRTEAKQNG